MHTYNIQGHHILVCVNEVNNILKFKANEHKQPCLQLQTTEEYKKEYNSFAMESIYINTEALIKFGT